MKWRSYLWVLLLFGFSDLFAQQNPDVIAYINSYKSIAMAEMIRTGVPASITLAQGIHESESGKSNLVQRSNNHFGIKCKTGWEGGKVYHDDDERGECFRSYQSPEESYRDHSDFLKKGQRYAFLFALDPADYKEWAYGLKKAGYATNIRYSQILIRIIEQYNLQQYTLIAMGKLQPGDEILAGSGTVLPPVVQSGPSQQVEEEELPAIDYPSGVFRINDTKVVYAPAGTALLSIAETHGLSLARLMDFNDIYTGDILKKGQLVFLQRKRKRGSVSHHIVQKGESLYSICQTEGLRMEELLDYNLLKEGMEPAVGEKLYLQEKAAAAPRLQTAEPVAVVKQEVRETVEPASTEIRQQKHIVKEKETLYSIAKRYGTTVELLVQWNKLPGTQLKKGQELIIYNQ